MFPKWSKKHPKVSWNWCWWLENISLTYEWIIQSFFSSIWMDSMKIIIWSQTRHRFSQNQLGLKKLPSGRKFYRFCLGSSLYFFSNEFMHIKKRFFPEDCALRTLQTWQGFKQNHQSEMKFWSKCEKLQTLYANNAFHLPVAHCVSPHEHAAVLLLLLFLVTTESLLIAKSA